MSTTSNNSQKTELTDDIVQKTADDCISRRAAIDEMWKIRRQQQMLDDTLKADLVMQGIYLAEKALKRMPSAQPEQETGRWIKISPANIYECSECGKNVMTDDICAYQFCHGCGIKMEGDEE